MLLLKERLLRDAVVMSKDRLKVDTFLNHQIDPLLLKEIGREMAERWRGTPITKVITIESSGQSVGLMTALELEVPFLFAKKTRLAVAEDDPLATPVISMNRGSEYAITVSAEFVSPGDRFLIIDDFLGYGHAGQGLIELIHKGGAEVAGLGFVIDKAWQGGHEKLVEQGYRVESLVAILSLESGCVVFKE
eukprot:TRINITY_DN2103_c0_g1_i1.p1 TRINITY_DN2103_c0_g1~~TRINITY_DN2103_c0_g1_i1.p1  ORF type:complete len:191 (+),score=50.50 TRINITY_DN2103_c0_g1_i1:122-694(+)